MISFAAIIAFLWLGINGVICLIAPRWKVAVEKRTADSKEAKRVRILGALQLAVCGFLVWAFGLAIGPSSLPGAAPNANELERVLYEQGAKFVQRGKTAGLTIAAISGGKEAVVEIGFADLGRRKPVTPDTLFEIGSITKVFTGIALAQSVEKGELKVDDRIAGMLPNGFEVSADAKDVTLRHLTTHTSGFPRMPGRPGMWAIFNFVVFGGDPYAATTLGRFGEALKTVKLSRQPGQKMEYSNFGVCLLGWLLAQRAGTNYEQYIRARVLEPLGMNASHVNLSATEQGQFASGHRSVRRLGPIMIAWRSSPWTLPDHLAAAGGLRSTGRDMLKFLRANIYPEKTMMTAAIKRSHAELFREGDYRGVGMNWIRTHAAKDSAPLIWHNGGTGGFRSYLGFFENGSAGVVVLSNSAEDVDPLGAELLRAVVDATLSGK